MQESINKVILNEINVGISVSYNHKSTTEHMAQLAFIINNRDRVEVLNS